MFETIVFWFGIAFIFLILFCLVLALIIMLFEYIINPYKRNLEEEQYKKFKERYNKEKRE